MALSDKHKTENKITLQLLSVLIAVVLWAVISYTEDPVVDVTIGYIPVECRGIEMLESNGFTVPYMDSMPMLSMDVSGKRSDLVRVIRDARAYIDVSSAESAGTYTLDVNVEMPDNSVMITNQKLKKADVVIDSVISKEVPVQIRHTDKNKDYLVKSMPNQQTVTLTGSQLILSDIKAVSVAISTIDMTVDTQKEYTFKFLNYSDNEFDPKSRIKSNTNTISVSNELYTPAVMEVKAEIPESLSSLYDIDVVQQLSVNAGIREGAPDKLTAVFPENAVISLGADDYTLTLKEEDGVYVEEANKTLKARTVITKKELQYVQIPIRFKNLPSNMTAWCETPSIDTYVNCVPSKLAATTLTAYADVKGMSEGVHDVMLSIEGSNDVKVIGEYKVRVTLSKKNSSGSH